MWLKMALDCFILKTRNHGGYWRNGMTASQTSLRTKDRRKEIARAAYCAIAEKGFEGLRMREIAARAGLNHSTLHYYYAGKEALIEGVMAYMVQELSLGRDNAAPTSPREQLAAHLAALLHQAREHPEMFVVLAEIHGRSARDPGIRSVMSRNERAWKKFIIEILRAGIRCGDFAPGLDADVAAEAVVALIRGLNFGHSGSIARAERALRLLMKWLEGERKG
jgi:AcrR family transcriptional regulator